MQQPIPHWEDLDGGVTTIAELIKHLQGFKDQSAKLEICDVSTGSGTMNIRISLEERCPCEGCAA